MVKSFWEIVKKVIARADILLLVLDSRLLPETRNKEIEDKISKSGKKIIYVANKCDLVDKDTLEKEIREMGLKPCVFVSSVKHFGVTKLRQRIKIAQKKLKKKEVVVGVLGYPNVGKSSVINLLKGKGAAKTSSQAGFTRGYQFVRAETGILLIDTPGVLAYKEKDEVHQSLIGAIDFNKVKEPDIAAADLIDALKGKIEKHYKVKKGIDSFDVIDEIARKYNLLKKGGLPDSDKAARMILKDWQYGKIKLK